jgi:hypothetical protein
MRFSYKAIDVFLSQEISEELAAELLQDKKYSLEKDQNQGHLLIFSSLIRKAKLNIKDTDPIIILLKKIYELRAEDSNNS